MSGIGIFGGALCAGLVLGLFYFGGLWWTIQRGVHSSRSVVWFATSTLVRMGIAVATLYIVLDRSGLLDLMACLTGLLIARAIIVRALRLGSTARSAS